MTDTVVVPPTAASVGHTDSNSFGTPNPPADTTPPPAKPAEPANGTQKPDLAAEKFAALARKEKSIFRKSQEVAEKDKGLAERERRVQEFEALEKNAKLEPLKALERLGLTYQDLTNYILNNEKATGDLQLKALTDQVTELRQQLEKDKQTQLEQAKKTAEEGTKQTIANFQAQITNFVATNKDSYELCALNDAGGLIYEVIQMAYEKSAKEGEPRIMSIKEATEQVEEYLAGQVEKSIQVKRFKDKFQPVQKAQDANLTPDGSKIQTTLTNSMAGGTAGSLPATTEAERIARAIAAMG